MKSTKLSKPMSILPLFLLLFLLLFSSLECLSLERAAPHTVFDKAATASLLNWWKPQIVGGEITSVTGVFQYTRARIGLERAKKTSGILDDEFNLYVVSHAVPNTTTLIAALWSSPQPEKLERFRRFRRWHEHNFGETTLLSGEGMEDEEDKLLWILSGVEEEEE